MKKTARGRCNISNNAFLVQSNKITNANWEGWSVVQRRCYYLVLGIILEFFEYGKNIQISDYVANERNVLLSFEANRILLVRDNISDAYKALFSLREKSFRVERENGGWLVCGFLNWAEYKERNKETITIEVSHKVLPYILQLAKNYTVYQLQTALALGSLYSQKFYELCCRHRLDGFFSCQISALRNLFNFSEGMYPNFADFKRKVIQTAEKELRQLYYEGNSDVYFTWEADRTTKIGKKITQIFFYVHKNQNVIKAMAEADYRWHIEAKLLAYFKHSDKVITSFYGWAMCNYNVPAMHRLLYKVIKIENRYPNKRDTVRVLRVMLRQDFNIF